MKASDITPTSFGYGNKPKTFAILSKWNNIRKNTRLMEESLLSLMNNPATTPEQLALASKMYANVTQQLQIHANVIDDYIYHGTKPTTHMLSCPAHKTGNEELCECKDWSEE